jgi:hypothetical protein
MTLQEGLELILALLYIVNGLAFVALSVFFARRETRANWLTHRSENRGCLLAAASVLLPIFLHQVLYRLLQEFAPSWPQFGWCYLPVSVGSGMAYALLSGLIAAALPRAWRAEARATVAVTVSLPIAVAQWLFVFGFHFGAIFL